MFSIKSMMLILSLMIMTGPVYSQTDSFGVSSCGWLENPSPANIWYTDISGQWMIAQQGKAGLSDDQMNQLYLAMSNKDEFVKTNNNYGFSCVCLKMDVDSNAQRVSKVYQAKQVLLKQCLENNSIISLMPIVLTDIID